MQGRRCCVHWNARADFEAEFPGIAVDSDTIFLEDRDRITCPGGQSSADVALHLIAKHCGAPSARKAAAGMVLEQMRGNRTYIDEFRPAVMEMLYTKNMAAAGCYWPRPRAGIR